MKWIIQGGPFVQLQVLISIVILMVVIRQIMALFKAEPAVNHKMKNRNDLIIYLGILSLFVGLFGHFMGLFNAFRVIIVATEIDPLVVTEGFHQAAIPTIYGFWSLLVSSGCWIVLKLKYQALKGVSTKS
jgi:biopolymer transport protein ExbB/TolQ